MANNWYDRFFTKRIKISPGKVATDNRSLLQLINGYGITTNQEVRDRAYVEQGYQKNPNVQAIINITQRNAGQVPWGIYKEDKNGNKSKVSNRMLQEIMRRPNVSMTWSDLINELIGFYMLQGDMYLWGVSGTGINSGKYTVLRPLPSQHVQIHVDKEGFGGVGGYTLDYSRNRNNIISEQNKSKMPAISIEAVDMLHIKNWNPEYDEDSTFFYGQSPLRAARRSIEVNNYAIDTSIAYLQNQGIRGLLFRKDNPDVEFSEDQIDQLQDNFNKKKGGIKNSNRVGVTDGEFGFINLMNTAADLGLLEQYVQSTKDICNVYGFPSLLLDIGNATYANRQEAKKQLWNDVIIPMLNRVKEGLNSWLVPMYGENLYLDFDLTNVHAIQEDLLSKGKAIKEFAGMITVNEARVKAGMPPLASSDPRGEETFVQFTQTSDKGDGKDKPKEEDDGE